MQFRHIALNPPRRCACEGAGARSTCNDRRFSLSSTGHGLRCGFCAPHQALLCHSGVSVRSAPRPKGWQDHADPCSADACSATHRRKTPTQELRRRAPALRRAAWASCPLLANPHRALLWDMSRVDVQCLAKPALDKRAKSSKQNSNTSSSDQRNVQSQMPAQIGSVPTSPRPRPRNPRDIFRLSVGSGASCTSR